jgi:hypothetical protein
MAWTRFKNKQSKDLKEDSDYEPTRKMLERNIHIKKGKTGYEIPHKVYGEKLRGEVLWEEGYMERFGCNKTFTLH